MTPIAYGLIVEEIKRRRKARGWRQADLAASAGVALATVGRIEARLLQPSLDMLDKLASALECPLEVLIIREEHAPKRKTRTYRQKKRKPP